MKQRKKKVVSIEDFLKKETFNQKYKSSLAAARATGNDENNLDKFKIRTGYYSMRTKIMNNPWVEQRPASKALSWLFKEVFKDPTTYKYNRRLLYQSGLFAFEYKNPKYKDTKKLLWFDKYPLVLSLGPVVTNLGVRNIGFNLHLLPPKVRILVVCQIFELYKRLYRYQVFLKQDQPVQIYYRQIVNVLEKYGVKFSIRMYIPSRMNKIVIFPIKTWHKAVFLPSQGYDSIRAANLVKEWKIFCRHNSFSGNENISWKSII